jgi:hypothetical protein
MCLLELFREEEPSICCVRPTHAASLVYGCGDASGSGFGASFVSDNNDQSGKISYRIGIWGSDEDDALSNFRELQNLVESIEYEVKRGHLRNAELFMFTDNSTAEVAYYQGLSKNKKLFELVL